MKCERVNFPLRRVSSAHSSEVLPSNLMMEQMIELLMERISIIFMQSVHSQRIRNILMESPYLRELKSAKKSAKEK